MSAKSSHLLAAAGAAALLGAALFRGMESGVLRTAFGLALLLFLPGYVWTEALFPPGAMRTSERVAMTLGLSMALAIVSGLLLNRSPQGLQASSWALWMTLVVLIGASVALLRHRQGVVMPALVTTRQPVRQPEVLLFAMAALSVGAAVGIGYRAAAQQEVTNFTQLSLLQNSSSTVEVQIANLESSTVAYRLEIRSGQALIERLSPIRLQPGQRWQGRVALPANTGDRMVQALLFRLDKPDEPYRRAQLWLRPAGAM